MNELQWHDMVASAYRILYDFVALRQHPLCDFLLQGQDIEPKERGWKTHNLLLKFIEELNPQKSSPLSKVWRRHRLLVLRYIEVVPPHEIANQLAISRRQFYREHQAAIDALVTIIQAQYDMLPDIASSPTALQDELLRMEQHDSSANLTETIEGILTVLDKVLQVNQLSVSLHIPPNIPMLAISQNILRQVLMGILGVVVGHHATGEIQIHATAKMPNVEVVIQFQSPTAISQMVAMGELKNFVEMLQFTKGDLQFLPASTTGITQLFITLPVIHQYTILIVDDNQDTLDLYQRFLSNKNYHVVMTDDANATISLALKIKPDCIILDLMMPNRDGWDLLQSLTNHLETHTIPVIICSVLKQGQLAHSLGATMFLQKPFTEQSLLDTLAHLTLSKN